MSGLSGLSVFSEGRDRETKAGCVARFCFDCDRDAEPLLLVEELAGSILVSDPE